MSEAILLTGQQKDGVQGSLSMSLTISRARCSLTGQIWRRCHLIIGRLSTTDKETSDLVMMELNQDPQSYSPNYFIRNKFTINVCLLLFGLLRFYAFLFVDSIIGFLENREQDESPFPPSTS